MELHENEPIRNIHVDEPLQFARIQYPPGWKLIVDFVNGKKEGPASIISNKRITIAKLNFHDDKLHGLCIFNNTEGEKEKEVEFEEDVANGWYCCYQNLELVEMGINRNGQKYSELCEFSENPSFLQEVKDGKVISVCKYNSRHQKDGYCYFFENGELASATLFENGTKLYKVYEMDGEKMKEYGRDGKMLYGGEWKGSIVNGLMRSGRGRRIEYEGDTVQRIVFLENDEEKGYQLF